ncbi:STAS domain-containing protein [Nonomuraea dietziae]|uniref:STAS domain-containing protein n=1 Tax=Nonomuraea dietziae TaxID=65515 RepID=UPI00340A20B1
MTELTVTKTRHREHWVLVLTGELDVLTCPQLLRELNDLLAEHDQHVIVDITGLRFCDVAGLRLFVWGTASFFEAGGWLRLHGVCRTLLRLADLLAYRSVLSFIPALPHSAAALCSTDQSGQALPASIGSSHGAPGLSLLPGVVSGGGGTSTEGSSPSAR